MISTKEICISDDAWEPCGLNSDNYTRLITCLNINGCNMHLEAWQVHMVEGVQETVDPHLDLDAYYTASGANEPFTTTTMFGRDYVLLATPYCD